MYLAPGNKWEVLPGKSRIMFLNLSIISSLSLGEFWSSAFVSFEILDTFRDYWNFMDKRFSKSWTCCLWWHIIPLLPNNTAGFRFKENNLKRRQEFDQSLSYFELNWTSTRSDLVSKRLSAMMRQRIWKVADYLFQTEEWTMYELILFGNLILLANVDSWSVD